MAFSFDGARCSPYASDRHISAASGQLNRGGVNPGQDRNTLDQIALSCGQHMKFRAFPPIVNPLFTLIRGKSGCGGPLMCTLRRSGAAPVLSLSAHASEA